uniref:DUF2889 domain-containing protein n=1 Tax=Nocardia abscessus TaxID=120957 RepID=UPI001E2FC3BB|nr:DUF2889 domain-containing protein [Nocardia abscessus]
MTGAQEQRGEPAGGISVPPELTPRGPLGPAPRRRPGSVRRTSTIDMRWPAGPGTQLRLDGRVRDLRTPLGGGPPEILDFAGFAAGVEAATRMLEWLETVPEHPGTEALIGLRGGSNSRGVLAEVMDAEAAAGAGSYLLLDDIAGATLIAGFAYSRWFSEGEVATINRPPLRPMTGVCTGFMPGSGALMPDGTGRWDRHTAPVPELDAGDDSWAWHELERITAMSMRRARRIDVWLENETIMIDSMFQDSATVPGGGRVAVHEYRLTGEADPHGTVRRLDAEPRVLPYHECPLAARGLESLIGLPLRQLRTEVLNRLPGAAGCTHLNDAARALAEVPALVRSLVSEAED